MRIVQHKTHNSERPAKDAEDCTGLTVNFKIFIKSFNKILLFLQQPVSVNTMSVSGAPVKGNVDYTTEAVQVAHTPKPPNHVSVKHPINIQQPRKWIWSPLVGLFVSEKHTRRWRRWKIHSFHSYFFFFCIPPKCSFEFFSCIYLNISIFLAILWRENLSSARIESSQKYTNIFFLMFVIKKKQNNKFCK